MEYRNELKYEVSDIELNKIKYRLLPLMEMDKNQGTDGYIIRSAYFDDIYDTYMQENESGIDIRKKYRIRTYNHSTNIIRLEKKSKYRGMTKKESQKLTSRECEYLLSGNIEALYENNLCTPGTLLEEVCIQMIRKQLSAKCIVEYERFAFIEEVGNVRITFDRNIIGSKCVECFFEPQIDSTPILPTGRHILEIKFDELLPQYILQAIDIGNLRRQSFSKYYSARKAIC